MEDTHKMEPDRKRLKLESDVILENVPVECVAEDSDVNKAEPGKEGINTDSTDDNENTTYDTAVRQSDSRTDLDQEETEKITQNKDDNSSVKKNIADLDSEKDTPMIGKIVSEQDDRTKPVQEKDVGITEYISKHAGFQGVIKQRYSDFLVSEIDLNGQVVKLTNFDLPPEEVIVKTNQDVSDVLNDSDMEKLNKLIESGNKTETVMIEVDADKDKRAKIHKAIATGFSGLESTTVNKDEKKYIQVKIECNKAHNHKSWPKERGGYCRFVLYKENKDTMDAIGLLAKLLRLKSGLFQYAGTKDRRAKTSQEVTAYRISAEKLLQVNKKLRNIATGNYRYVKDPLRLGDSKGNRFTMVLR